MFCWNKQTKDVKFVSWPDTKGESSDYLAVGACDDLFRLMDTKTKVLAMLTHALFMVEHANIPMERMYAALMEVDEIKESIIRDPFRN